MHKGVKDDLDMISQQLKELERVYRRAVSKSGMSENEFWIWYALLVVGGEYSQQDLCGIWSIPKQTANTIVANLVKKGYVSLEMIPGTRNRKRIRLSEEGKQYGTRVVMPIYQAEQRTLEKLPEWERKNCLDILRRYISILKGELCES